MLVINKLIYDDVTFCGANLHFNPVEQFSSSK